MDHGKLIKSAVILDFDGTICRLFEGYDLRRVKAELCRSLSRYKVELSDSQGCFEAYGAICRQLSRDVGERTEALMAADQILMEAECQAVETGVDVEGVRAFMERCLEAGIALGIATNNSEKCVEKYLRSRGMGGEIPIAGRDGNHPERMKPNPWTLNRTMDRLGVRRNGVLFIGDNPTDYRCARAAEVDFAAMVSTQKKRARFEGLQDRVTMFESYYDLLNGPFPVWEGARQA